MKSQTGTKAVHMSPENQETHLSEICLPFVITHKKLNLCSYEKRARLGKISTCARCMDLSQWCYTLTPQLNVTSILRILWDDVTVQLTISSYLSPEINTIIFVCVGVMYSGEHDVCDVTLSVHPHARGKLKSQLLWLWWESNPRPLGY